MNLRQQIEVAFAHRQSPVCVVEFAGEPTPEQNDALWFTRKDWHHLNRQDWERHPDAIYAFTPEAFLYYVPSILTVTLESNGQWLQVADSLIGFLNRTPTVEYWDSFFCERFVGLSNPEYEALQAWLLSLSGNGVAWCEDALSRAYETVDLLKRETERLQRFVNAR
ncbi:MAG: hypothetical protein LBV29_00760 [Azoarcus sp.]|jgi:hypothetical protein|nr:hypothetical protein [Azoarcus sp.]